MSSAASSDARRRIREMCDKNPGSGALPAYNSYSAIEAKVRIGNTALSPYATFLDTTNANSSHRQIPREENRSPRFEDLPDSLSTE